MKFSNEELKIIKAIIDGQISDEEIRKIGNYSNDLAYEKVMNEWLHQLKSISDKIRDELEK